MAGGRKKYKLKYREATDMESRLIIPQLKAELKRDDEIDYVRRWKIAMIVIGAILALDFVVFPLSMLEKLLLGGVLVVLHQLRAFEEGYLRSRHEMIEVVDQRGIILAEAVAKKVVYKDFWSNGKVYAELYDSNGTFIGIVRCPVWTRELIRSGVKEELPFLVVTLRGGDIWLAYYNGKRA